jgi:hypothetical protein
MTQPDPGFGERYGAGPQSDMVTDDGTEVWLFRKGQRCRFYDAQGVQVGPEHRNVAPAVTWAHAHLWSSPSNPAWLNEGCQREVRANLRSKARR